MHHEQQHSRPDARAFEQQGRRGRERPAAAANGLAKAVL